MGIREVKTSGKQCREFEPICKMWIAVLSHGALNTPSTHSTFLAINGNALLFRRRIEGRDMLLEIRDDCRVEKRCKSFCKASVEELNPKSRRVGEAESSST